MTDSPDTAAFLKIQGNANESVMDYAVELSRRFLGLSILWGEENWNAAAQDAAAKTAKSLGCMEKGLKEGERADIMAGGMGGIGWVEG